jgi:serine/threonine protein kinase/Tfp pilus assembly protein PilF
MSPITSNRWQSLSPYLDKALEMPEQERSVWLSSLRAEDPDLAREINKLLQEYIAASQEQYLEKSVPHWSGLVGQEVGVYTLISQIGQGGMGSVWLAERNDGRFERRVAVKLLNISLMGAAGETRFRREGTILGKLAHPHIAQLLDAGVSQAGQPFLVLEHVEGEHIDSYCDEHKLNVQARIRLFIDVLSAVAKAHTNLIVHRDLKPSNVLVRYDGKAKLLDFGIAKLLEGDGQMGEATLLTVEGGRAMTPEFAAPEQLTGDPITTATDVYSLGVLLFILLTGQHPAGVTPRTAADLVKAVVDTESSRPSDAVDSFRAGVEATSALATKRGTTPDKLRRMLRGDLDTVLAKALKKDPTERYPSAAAFADDLGRYLKNLPITARPDKLTYRAAKFIWRHRAAVALATLTIIAVSAGIIGTLIETQRARTQRDFALRQMEQTEALDEFHQFLLSDAAPSGKPFTVNTLLEQAERIVKRQHATDDPDRVELLISIGRQYVEQDRETNANRVLEEAYNLSRDLTDRSARAEASCAWASSLARAGEAQKAESLYQEGMRELPQDPQFALQRIACLQSGAEIALEAGDIKQGITRAETAQCVLRDSPFDSDVLEMHRWTDLAKVYGAAGQDAQALAAYEKSGALMSSLGRDETGTAFTLFNNWALQLHQMGRPLEAEALFRRAIQIGKTGDGEEVQSPVILTNYAHTLRELGHLKEAAKYAERGYTDSKRVGIEINHALLERARIYTAQGNPDRADAMLAEVEPRLRRSLPPGHFAFAVLELEKSRNALVRGDIASAQKFVDQAVAIDEAAIKAGKEGSHYLPTLLVGRSEIEFQAGHADLAAADASRAINLLHETMRPGTFSCVQGRAFLALGHALQAQSKTDQARAAFRSAAENLQSTVGANHPDTRNAHQMSES